MALDLAPIATVVDTLTASIKALTDLAAAKIAEADGAAAQVAVRVAADESAAVATLGLVADHLGQLVAQIDAFVAASQTPAVPASATVSQ